MFILIPLLTTQVVRVRNVYADFYSIFSNNCQHFILDLCEQIKLQPWEAHFSGDNTTDPDTPIPNVAREGHIPSSDLQSLWIQSRVVFVFGCFLNLLIGFSLSLIGLARKQVQLDGQLHWFLLLYEYFVFWLNFSTNISGMLNGEPVHTMTGQTYRPSTCQTGPHMKGQLRLGPDRNMGILFLLRMESIPYDLFLTLGCFFGLFVDLSQMKKINSAPPDSPVVQSWLTSHLTKNIIFVVALAVMYLLIWVSQTVSLSEAPICLSGNSAAAEWRREEVRAVEVGETWKLEHEHQSQLESGVAEMMKVPTPWQLRFEGLLITIVGVLCIRWLIRFNDFGSEWENEDSIYLALTFLLASLLILVRIRKWNKMPFL